MDDAKWYVVKAVSGQEKKVKIYLERERTRLGLESLVSEPFIPIEKVYEMRGGKKKIREKNFFPGYILIQADLSNGEIIHLIKGIPGVLGFLGNEKGASKDPVPLRQAEVDRIFGRVDENAEMETQMDRPFILGEDVNVMDGPFNGFTGTVQEIFEDKRKLNVMVKIFGRNTPVELNFFQVEKIQ